MMKGLKLFDEIKCCILCLLAVCFLEEYSCVWITS